MITWSQALMQAGCIVLMLMLFPSTARLEEKTGPTATQPAGVQQSGNGAAENKQTDASPLSAADETQTYAIKNGDTLWDIANTFLKDPFLWPFIWKANPAITNPDLIFAGGKLTIPSLTPIERALQAAPTEEKTEKEQPVVAQVATKETAAPEQPVVEEQIAPQSESPVVAPKIAAQENDEAAPASRSKLYIPEEKVLPIVDKYAMISAGYISEVEQGDSITGSPEPSQSIFGYDHVVYVSIANGERVNIGDKFLIYAPLNKVKHPKTKKYVGRLIKGLGILQIKAKDSPTQYTARVTLSFDAIEKGNLITPYQEPALLFSTTNSRSLDLTGYILEVSDRRSINAQTDFVYIDLGSADGVQAGDRFLVYSDQERKDDPKKVIGELLVMLVKENTSTAVVRKSTDTMSKGNMVSFKK